MHDYLNFLREVDIHGNSPTSETALLLFQTGRQKDLAQVGALMGRTCLLSLGRFGLELLFGGVSYQGSEREAHSRAQFKETLVSPLVCP